MMHARRRDDHAVAGVVAGIIMVGALVAFLAYFVAVWVPTYVGNQESSHATNVREAMDAYADAIDDRIARGIVGRSLTRAVPLGVSGIPVLGKGASAGDLAVEATPRLNVSLDATALATAGGAVALSTHTQQYPNQTYRYAFGALEVGQSDGAFVDLRNLIHVQRAGAGHLNVTLQVVDVTGAPQSAAGNGEATVGATVNGLANATTGPGSFLRINITGLAGTGGAWRVAFDRTLSADVLTGETAANCYATTKDYCFFSATTTTTSVDLLLRDVGAASASTASVAAEVRG